MIPQCILKSSTVAKKMEKAVLVLFLCVISCIYYQNVNCQDQYTNKFDNIDLDEVLQNDRLVQSYADCILEKGNCTPEGEEIKSHIKEALETECAKCSDKQKDGIKKVITFLAKEKPDIWNEVQEKYDPEGKYKEKYEDLLKSK